MEHEFQQKKMELSRKLESASKKHEDDLAKLKLDRDRKLEVLFASNFFFLMVRIFSELLFSY